MKRRGLFHEVTENTVAFSSEGQTFDIGLPMRWFLAAWCMLKGEFDFLPDNQ
jgi:hypothetical protein